MRYTVQSAVLSSSVSSSVGKDWAKAEIGGGSRAKVACSGSEKN